MNHPLSAAIDKDFGDSWIDVLETERRLAYVKIETYLNTETWMFLKVSKEGNDDEYYLAQRPRLSAFATQRLTNNGENIVLQAGTEEKGIIPTINWEKPFNNRVFSIIHKVLLSHLSTSGSNSIPVFMLTDLAVSIIFFWSFHFLVRKLNFFLNFKSDL